MIQSPITRVLSSMKKNGVDCLLMGGQACVLYGGAEFSRDIDFALHVDAGNLQRLERALEEHLSGKQISKSLTNPIGCNVKWEGQDAHWMPAEACDLVFDN